MLDVAQGDARRPLAGRLFYRQCDLDEERLFFALRRDRDPLAL
jgi:hypothetical protein